MRILIKLLFVLFALNRFYENSGFVRPEKGGNYGYILQANSQVNNIFHPAQTISTCPLSRFPQVYA